MNSVCHRSRLQRSGGCRWLWESAEFWRFAALLPGSFPFPIVPLLSAPSPGPTSLVLRARSWRRSGLRVCGHRYCSKSCSERGRRERRRESNRRYAASEGGLETNRRRQQLHRMRHALPARADLGSAATASRAPPSVRFVTDHGSATPARRLPGAVRSGDSFPRCARCSRPCPQLVAEEMRSRPKRRGNR